MQEGLQVMRLKPWPIFEIERGRYDSHCCLLARRILVQSTHKLPGHWEGSTYARCITQRLGKLEVVNLTLPFSWFLFVLYHAESPAEIKTLNLCLVLAVINAKCLFTSLNTTCQSRFLTTHPKWVRSIWFWTGRDARCFYKSAERLLLKYI